MKIKSVDVIPLRVPFEDGSKGVGLMPSKWTSLEIALVRIETTDGLVGWGDGFAYHCMNATVAVIRDMVAPLVVGQEIDDIPAFNRALQQRLHLHGRYGITIFGISAVDIALWDLAAKAKGVSLAALVGGRDREVLPAYASLVRYTEPAEVQRFTEKAVGEGYATVKLHEIALDAIEGGRAGAPEHVKLVTDVNCNWSLETAHQMMPHMKRMGLYWVEEPVFPPDDEAVLGGLQRQYGVAIASGENACTAVEFRRTVPHIRFVQPSVTKVGGVSEFLAVCDVAQEAGATVMPHSPYFGPGYWATVQLMAARPVCEQVEVFYITPEAYLDASFPQPEAGTIAVPDRPGLGFEPDPALIARYAA
ncbi:MAG: mandelate racemase/muconate lactonizing enzyme family protein [Hyphomicrobiaceae bacterium]|nr:mandelate racemase/muconate lactonizing enzyme family protein [Hyphomicrobiaceae bacterium]